MAKKKILPAEEIEKCLKSTVKKVDMKIRRKITPIAILAPIDSRTVKLPLGLNFTFSAIVQISGNLCNIIKGN